MKYIPIKLEYCVSTSPFFYLWGFNNIKSQSRLAQETVTFLFSDSFSFFA